MKSILIVVKNLTSGGAEKQSVVLAKSLSDVCSVHYVVFNGTKVHDKYVTMMDGDNINIVRLEGNFLKRFKQLISFIRNNHIDFVFSYLTGANLISAVSSLFVKTRVFTGLRNSQLPYPKLLMDRFALNHLAYGAVVNCYSGKQAFAEKGFNQSKMYVIPNAMDSISPYSNREENEFFDVITVGRFVEQKDYETAIRSISLIKEKVPNIRFHIVGYGELESKIRLWVEVYGIQQITEIYINPSNIRSLLLNSDVYLSTSLFEGTSNSIMEAMNADLPIVATNVGDNAFLVEEGRNGYLTGVKDAEAIASRLCLLSANESERKTLGLESKKIISERFSMDLFKQRYWDLIQ